MVCGREKYSGHSPPLLCLPANGAWELQKVEGLLIPSLCETSHSTADSDAAQAARIYRKADGLPEVCFPSLASQKSFNTDLLISNLTKFLQLNHGFLFFRL